MPVITEYRHGMTMGIPPGRNTHPRAKRENVEGWSESSTRRNKLFLYGVDERKLTGYGFAVTLTVKNCPPTAEQWTDVREAYFDRLRRMGLIRAHWLTEWQRRGVPHMHSALWLPAEDDAAASLLKLELVDHWLAVAGAWGAGTRGQQVNTITDAVGWFQYLSKHAVRGLNHYQRARESIPEGWKRTGRMWGKLGGWDEVEPVRYLLGMPGFYAFRRVVQRWRLADARESGDLGRIRAARGMLQSPDRAVASVRGVSEWIGRDMTSAIVAHLAASGHEVRC